MLNVAVLDDYQNVTRKFANWSELDGKISLKVFNKYISEDNLLKDAKGYHKSLFAARNADALANHFYEQGRADAIKNMTSEAKNIKMDRKTADGMVDTSGIKVRVISGDNSSTASKRLKNY